MQLYVFATLLEAHVTIEALHAKKSSSMDPYLSFEFDRGWIVISGIGLLEAMGSVFQAGSPVQEICNLGFAGSLDPSLELGSIKTISTVTKYIPQLDELDPFSHQLTERSFPLLTCPSQGLRLITSDTPIQKKELHSCLKKRGDLVDMEGYGIAFAAMRLRKPCFFWKIVSDFASLEGRHTIIKYQHHFSEKLAEIVMWREKNAPQKNHESCCDSFL